MRHDDFDLWFQDVKTLAGAPRLRASDIWHEDSTWHDAFLECLTPEEAVNDAMLSDVSRTTDQPRRKPARLPGIAIASFSRIRRAVGAKAMAYLVPLETTRLGLLPR